MPASPPRRSLSPPPRRHRSRSRSRERPRRRKGGFRWKDAAKAAPEPSAGYRGGDRDARDTNASYRGYRDSERRRDRDEESYAARERRRDGERWARLQEDAAEDRRRDGRERGDGQGKEGGDGQVQEKSDGQVTEGRREGGGAAAGEVRDAFGEAAGAQPDKVKTKKRKVAPPQEEMIIVHVNDRLGTKAAIPCLASDPIRKLACRLFVLYRLPFMSCTAFILSYSCRPPPSHALTAHAPRPLQSPSRRPHRAPAARDPAQAAGRAPVQGRAEPRRLRHQQRGTD